MPRYQLSEHVRFRKEVDCILVCDCKRLLDFQLPLEHFDLLIALQKGYDPECSIRNSEEVNLIDDLIKTELIHEVGKLPEIKNVDIWSRLTYEETEHL